MKIIDKSQQQLAKKLPFVIYRKPNQDSILGFFQEDDTLYATKNYKSSGFVFAPFDNRLPSYIFPSEKCDILEETILSPNKTNTSNPRDTSNKDSKEKHIHLVEKAIDKISTSDLQKIVVSRVEDIEKSDFDPFESFLKMVSLYSNAFVYLWYHPKEGTWMGATPETLLKIKNGSFHTIALASTQSYEGTKEVSWGQKEQEEHQFVKDYIVDQLQSSSIPIDKFDVSPTYTVKAGNLLHLRADIRGEIQDSHVKKIIEVLHPTPAVCGLPQDKAKEFILQNENYHREFYTGFLGEVHIDSSSELYVNLRCMQIKKNKIQIYVGGGVTQDSDSKKEWEETVSKTKTIKQVL